MTYIDTPGMTSSNVSVWDINSRGQISGGSNTAGYPFVWTPGATSAATGTTTKLPMPLIRNGIGGGTTPYTAGSAWGINDYGQLAGYAGAEARALLWTPSVANGATYSFVDLLTTTGQPAHAAYHVNALGQVSGRYGGLLWSPSTPNSPTNMTLTLVPLGPNGDTTPDAMAINDRGDMTSFSNAGGYWRPATPNGTVGTRVAAPQLRYLNNVGLAVSGTGIADAYVVRISDDAIPTITTIYTKTGDIAYEVNDAGTVVFGSGDVWSESDGLINIFPRLETHSAAGVNGLQLRAINETGQMAGKVLRDEDNNPSTPDVTSPVLLTPLTDGDANVDRVVNFTDLLTLASHYNDSTGATWLQGDFTGDGAVNFADLLQLAANYGSGPTGTFADDWALALSLVPEPTLALSLPLAALMLRQRRVG
ncbi:MAG: hypothetical protein QM770_00200 [Tepidisphaeraceae bacterium]